MILFYIADGWKLWRKLSFLVALPGIALCMLNVYITTTPETHEPPPFVAWEHMRIRTKVWL